jgi:hypothetical protein
VPRAPATIEQLASDAVNTDDPETALRALSALRNELEGLEPVLVSRALRGGATWSQIARSLGISKQAAHRKHRHLADQGGAGESEPGVRITIEARRSVQLARQEARRLGQPALGTEHLLLGILRCGDSHAVRALNALGVTHQLAVDALQPTMAAAADPAAGLDEDDVSVPARRILEGAVRASLARGDGYIGVEHLLLALLTDSRNGAVQTLEALRVNPGSVRRQLEQEWLAAGRPEG